MKTGFSFVSYQTISTLFIMNCTYCCGADKLFDLRGAQKEMKKYKRKGANKSTKKLLELLFHQNTNEKTLLDIGGGIGAIQWEFLEQGGKNTLDVDASNGYLEVAKSYAKEHNYMEKVRFLSGDLVEKAGEIDAYDFVTLDKVVCCYPDYESLLALALKKCKSTIALTFPMGGPISKFIAQMEEVYYYFKDISFGTYIHSPGDIEKFVHSKGFKTVRKTISFPWHVQIYEKVEEK